ncbi:MAG: hypothetical protein AMXMBFR84_07970 [Candidatus Hydrogenedentota bacterium]
MLCVAPLLPEMEPLETFGMSLLEIFTLAYVNPTEGPFSLAAAVFFGAFWPAIVFIQLFFGLAAGQ